MLCTAPDDLLLQRCDFYQIGTNLPVPGKGGSRGFAQLPNPAAKRAFGQSQITLALRHRRPQSVTSLTAST